MDNFNILNLTNFLGMSGFNILFKSIFLIADSFAIVFIFVVIKQIYSMDHIVHDSNDFLFIKTFAFALFFIAVSLFLITLVIL